MNIQILNFTEEMDRRNDLDDESERRRRHRELANARMKRYRESKRREAELLNSITIKDEPLDGVESMKLQEINALHRELSNKRSRSYCDDDDESDEKKRQRELANARVKRHRDWKRSEAERLKSTNIKGEPVDEIDEREIRGKDIEKRRALARERSRRYRQSKRLHALYSANRVIQEQEIPGTSDSEPPPLTKIKDEPVDEMEEREVPGKDIEKRRALSKERSRRYRESKRLHALKSVDLVIQEPKISVASLSEPPPLIWNRIIPVDDSQIAGTSANTDIPLLTRSNDANRVPEYHPDDNFSIQIKEEHLSGSCSEDNRPNDVDYDSAPSEDQACVSFRFNRSSMTYSSYARHSSAHIQFHKQFTRNEFGHACQICDRLWFKNDLKSLNHDGVEFVKTFLPNIDERSTAVCHTCRTSIQKKSIPKLAVHNGFKYPDIPANLLNYPLDLVSERLISPRIPFAQVRRLRHVHDQRGIYGQVINVPFAVDTMVDKLPRKINDDHCVYVNVERKDIMKPSLIRGLVDWNAVREWLRYLVDTPLYEAYDITIDEQFFRDEKFSLDDNFHLEDIPIEESPSAQQQTLMWNDDLDLRTPPGGNNFDEHAEELSFPTIYLGQLRKSRGGLTVTPFMMVSSELRRSDRRGVTPHHLLYMAMKIMRLRVRDSLPIALKHAGNKSDVTKDQLTSSDYINDCIESNLAFLRSIPNSTWYWSERKKDLFAMIRQLGKPTVFFTISANETGWSDLLQLLYKLKNHVSITKEAASQLDRMVKSTLVNEDAVTCAAYFNKLVNVVMNILQSKICSPFQKYRVLRYFKRIEFQQQGNPQARIFAWLDNAPKDPLDKDYAEAIELVDYLSSVSEAEASGNIQLQTHEHTFECYKNKAQKCRYEAPFMPSKSTMILTPMKDTEKGFNDYRKRYAQIRVRLENENFVDMDHFYKRNGIESDKDYHDVIRAGITRPKVFVKREPSEKWHRSFNPFIFNIVRSSTDFEFITDDYSCAAYVEEYVNETNRGVSYIQRKMIETINENPEFDSVDVMNNISVNILDHTEITCQEAAWYLLREPMSKTSVAIEYIPTVWPTERQRIRKTMRELGDRWDDNSIDIWKENWFDKYEKRSEHLEDVTLAQFVSKYRESRNGEFSERLEPKIIRYRNYDMTNDLNEYKREMVTLHLPFRNEEVEIIEGMKFINVYDENENIIMQRRREFESNIDVNKIVQICRELSTEENHTVDEDDEDKPKVQSPTKSTKEIHLSSYFTVIQ